MIACLQEQMTVLLRISGSPSPLTIQVLLIPGNAANAKFEENIFLGTAHLLIYS